MSRATRSRVEAIAGSFTQPFAHPPVFAGCATLLCALMLSGACGGTSRSISPSAPTPAPSAATPAATRIIGLGGPLNFGTVGVGLTATGSITIVNSGNATLTVTGITLPAGGAYAASWTSGTVAAGETRIVAVQFTPSAAGSYNGAITVNGDQTSGTNTLAVSGTGIVPPPGAAPFTAEAHCSDSKAGTYNGLACWVWVSITAPPSGYGEMQVNADLRAFGLSPTQPVVQCHGCGRLEYDLDLHIPAGMAAGPVPITFTVSDAAGYSVKSTATMTITR